MGEKTHIYKSIDAQHFVEWCIQFIYIKFYLNVPFYVIYVENSGHVHAGNVIIVEGVARLVDIENFILGVPSFYRPFFVQHSKINTSELIDVYSFGHLLYELTFGYPLQESITRQPIECPSETLSTYTLF